MGAGTVAMKRGEDWGTTGPLPADGVVVHSDSEARRVVSEARRRGAEPPTLGLAGGDLARTLGGRGDVDRLHSDDATRLQVDVGSALLDGEIHWFVAHLIARRGWARGRIVAVMNAEWWGNWSVGPRAHPGDGLLDITDASLSLPQRLLARRRLPSGSHVPHPEIRTNRAPAWQADFDPPLRVWLDHDLVTTARHVSVRVEPAAVQVVV